MTDRRDALDLALASMPAPEPSAALRRAVAEIPLRHPRAELDAHARANLWRAGWAWVVSGAFVLALGAFSGQWTSERGILPLDTETTVAANVETSDALDELEELAFAVEFDGEFLP